MRSVAVVTDSTCDLDLAMRERYGISVVPLFVQFGERRLRDGIDLEREDFYGLLATGGALPTTAQPTAEMFADAFRPLVAAGRSIVCLTIMGSLSETIDAARTAAGGFPGARIEIVDSETVAGGLALQAMHAADLARSGASVDEILAALASARARQRGYATVPDLTHALRTGRLSRTQAFVGSLVRVVPVLRIGGGRIAEETRVRTFERAQEAMVDAAAAAAGTGDGARLCVVHARAAEIAASIARRVRARLRAKPHTFDVVEAGPVNATHAGPGGVGIFVLPA